MDIQYSTQFQLNQRVFVKSLLQNYLDEEDDVYVLNLFLNNLIFKVKNIKIVNYLDENGNETTKALYDLKIDEELNPETSQYTGVSEEIVKLENIEENNLLSLADGTNLISHKIQSFEDFLSNLS